MANLSKEKQKNIAKHIAIIMDGNGRWALSNSLNISKGHSKGVEIVREIVEESVKQNISSLTLYAFSSENWSRPRSEIDAIKKLVLKAINEQVTDLKKQKVKLKFFGEIDNFGSKIISKINEAESATSSYKPVLNLNVALGYGGRQDIVNVAKKISNKVLSGEIKPDHIDEAMISDFSCSPVDNIDLLIRTGGENRISNFLLYQIAYTEILFINKYWPDFTKEDFIGCIDNFKKVSRRFGKRV
ncbi:polyprenyl diphosphate synthase [Gammaproteobacteria bacterium]|nr:polyprenyl diphosphate synthase [Gammaproteobacteria bacterium]